MDQGTFNHIQIIWNYLSYTKPLKKADFILALGSAQDSVAVHAAYLYHLNYSDTIVTSGGFGKVTQGTHSVTEGERFASIIEKLGVPNDSILVEHKASNTGENFLFTQKLLSELNKDYRSGIIVTKPYMTRRAYAAGAKQWPRIDWQTSSPQLSLERYLAETDTDSAINLMVGDVERMKMYAEKGFQIPQEVPAHVWESYEYLKSERFNQYCD
jgi:uncharacterized SAM-binding protein YcdF (DUF218 family)